MSYFEATWGVQHHLNNIIGVGYVQLLSFESPTSKKPKSFGGRASEKEMAQILRLLFAKNTTWLHNLKPRYEVFPGGQSINSNSPYKPFDPFWGIQLPQFCPIDARMGELRGGFNGSKIRQFYREAAFRIRALDELVTVRPRWKQQGEDGLCRLGFKQLPNQHRFPEVKLRIKKLTHQKGDLCNILIPWNRDEALYPRDPWIFPYIYGRPIPDGVACPFNYDF